MKEPTAAYIRVSTQEQKLHGLSIDAQEEKLRLFADANNLKIVEWYRDEGVSGRKPIKKRPELQRMILDAQAKKFRRIIFIKLDRFFRSVGEYYKCMELIGDIPWTATEESFDMTTANGKMLINMKLTIAQMEAETTGERIKLVNEYKVKSGRPLVGTPSMPFCYAVADKKIVKRNEEAMQGFLETFQTTHSVRAAMDYVNKNSGFTISHNSATLLLKNTMICGEYRGNPNYCEPYITRQEFDEIQKHFHTRTRTTKKKTFIFAGMIACPVCGRILVGQTHRCTNRGGMHYEYQTYCCGKHKVEKSCTFSASVFQNRVESLMIDYISPILSPYEVDYTAADAAHQKIDIEPLKLEIQRLNYAWEKGRIPVEEYDRKYDEISGRIKDAEEKNRITGRKIKLPEEFSGNWKEIYSELSDESKAAFWRSFVKRIEIDWEKGSKNGRKQIRSVEFY